MSDHTELNLHNPLMQSASGSNCDNLRRLLLLWALGDWPALVATENIADGAGTSLGEGYKAVAALQCGNLVTAKAAQIKLTLQASEKQHLARLFLASAYTCLSNAHYITGDNEHSERLLVTAVALTEPVTIRQTVLSLRAELQRQRLNMVDVESGLDPSASDFKVKPLVELNLGEAWAGNSVNTVIFRHHGVFTHNNMQYTAFYVDSKTLRVIQRNISTSEIISSDIFGEYNIRDAHNSISLGMDKECFIHISYDHHATQLKYRRSQAPNNIDSWSDELDMTGQRENKVTYPAFLMPSGDIPLQMLYRDGNHQKGSAYIKQYSGAEQRWSDNDSAILSGATSQPWTSNAYWNHPVRDNEGTLHMSFVWRTHSLGEQQQINNLNVCYAKSFDGGKSWYSSNMKPFRLPITQVNAEVVCAISPGSNLINQSSMAVDSHNQPHIVFYANDSNSIVQYQHLWFNGRYWQHQIISRRTHAFDLCGGGTLRIPISRPDIVIDSSDNVFVIYRGDLTEDRMAALCLKAPHYLYKQENQQLINSESLGFAEPVIDRLRWQQDQVLSMLIQYNDQPNHDVGHTHVAAPILLIDTIFALESST